MGGTAVTLPEWFVMNGDGRLRDGPHVFTGAGRFGFLALGGTAVRPHALPLLIDGRSLDEYSDWINELLNLVGLGDRQDHKPNQLFGG